jgi:hypothetical protein
MYHETLIEGFVELLIWCIEVRGLWKSIARARYILTSISLAVAKQVSLFRNHVKPAIRARATLSRWFSFVIVRVFARRTNSPLRNSQRFIRSVMCCAFYTHTHTNTQKDKSHRSVKE